MRLQPYLVRAGRGNPTCRAAKPQESADEGPAIGQLPCFHKESNRMSPEFTQPTGAVNTTLLTIRGDFAKLEG